MGVTNYLLTGMILQVGLTFLWNSLLPIAHGSLIISMNLLAGNRCLHTNCICICCLVGSNMLPTTCYQNRKKNIIIENCKLTTKNLQFMFITGHALLPNTKFHPGLSLFFASQMSLAVSIIVAACNHPVTKHRP